MAFTDENTTGYTAGELAAMNAEMEDLLIGIDDPDVAEEIKQTFADLVSRR